ncbi:hypothetical protein SAMN04488057_11273 [Cyclobacterium lianum]|uniref:Uncharacterized protein n=1 Tax=Cyclobacterium lianum TaxID=388280 RepID=A0A1M7PZK6_9BACT|nr:hypothetical protein [Cyclobacterium lianum]SHN23201.1 hypothetical protein SAMN04488057_11273 [Cyclobacterium lianum]
MFRKIPSSDKRTSGALRNELGNLPIKGKKRWVYLLKTYPRQCFAGMLISLMLSALLAFVIPIRHRTEQTNDPQQLMDEIKNLGSGMTDEVRSLFKIQDELKKMAELKKEVESIMAKEYLDARDSLFLENALRQLENYNHLNPADDED